MEKYESKQVQIRKSEETIFGLMSDFNNFTPILKDRVEGWTVDGDTCSFTVKGFAVRLRMIEKKPYKLVKIASADGSPFDFSFWVQLKGLASDDTRMKLTLGAKLNMMMKMMIGGKLQKGIDEAAEHIAAAFNQMPG
ncbi:MAG: polyketide cyclase [Rikenellaceae bacterium]|jgi:carbon monoxide dehydrogenase subunit G|nr:polyketide cyclase [Rikenellaceae bacterium]